MRRRLRAVPAVAVVGLLSVGAVAGLARTSLRPTADGGLSLAAWRRLAEDARFVEALGFTVGIAAITTVLSAILAVLLARAARDHGLVQTVLALPVLMPHLLVAAVAVLWLGPGGLADRLLDPLPFQVVRSTTGVGVVLVYLVKEVPFLALLVLASWGGRVVELEEAAAVGGASRQRRLWLVIVPALRTPLVIGSVLVGAFVLGSFEVPLLVGPTSPPTLAVHALEQTRLTGLAGRADAAAVLLATAMLALVLGAATLRLLPQRSHE